MHFESHRHSGSNPRANLVRNCRGPNEPLVLNLNLIGQISLTKIAILHNKAARLFDALALIIPIRLVVLRATHTLETY